MMRLVTVCLVLAAAPTLAGQQSAAPAADADPMRCWWRTSSGAVAIGQLFDVSLTCAVVDEQTVQVVVDDSRLAAGTVQLAPFDVLGGDHPPDLRSGRRRFFQYHYTLRIIDPDVIGKDVRLPDLQLHYRVNHPAAGGETVEGREQPYVLPGIPLRVLSLVPADAPDIRDSSPESFARVGSLRTRGRLLQVVAGGLAVLAVALFVPALLRVLQRTRRQSAARDQLVTAAAILRGVAAELTAIQNETRGGWSLALVHRTLAALRLAAACAVGRRVSQKALASDAEVPEGRLAIRPGFRRTRRVAVSSPLTAADVAHALEHRAVRASADQTQRLEALKNALNVLTEALYGRRSDLDEDRLSAALASGANVVAQLRRVYAWPRVWRSGRLHALPEPESLR